MKSEIMTLAVADLETCDRVRPRHQRPRDGSDVVLEYAEAYQCGLITEPLDVFREKGAERYIVADGENRLLALRRAKIKQIECRVYEGDEIDALDFATSCNKAHGLRRTKADIVHALTRILETPRLRSKYRTDTNLSEHLGISVASVKRYKALWRDDEKSDDPEPVRRAKETSRQTAEKHTSPSAVNGSVSRSQVIENTEDQGSHDRKSAPSVSAPPAGGKAKAIKSGNGWSSQDEADYHELCEVWERSTRNAQIRFATDHQ